MSFFTRLFGWGKSEISGGFYFAYNLLTIPILVILMGMTFIFMNNDNLSSIIINLIVIVFVAIAILNTFYINIQRLKTMGCPRFLELFILAYDCFLVLILMYYYTVNESLKITFLKEIENFEFFNKLKNFDISKIYFGDILSQGYNLLWIVLGVKLLQILIMSIFGNSDKWKDMDIEEYIHVEDEKLKPVSKKEHSLSNINFAEVKDGTVKTAEGKENKVYKID